MLVWRTSPVTAFSASTRTPTSIEVFQTALTDRAAAQQLADVDGLGEGHPVHARGDDALAAVADRGDARRPRRTSRITVPPCTNPAEFASWMLIQRISSERDAEAGFGSRSSPSRRSYGDRLPCGAVAVPLFAKPRRRSSRCSTRSPSASAPCSSPASTSSAPRSRPSSRSSPPTSGAEHCVGVANGTDALAIGLRALGVGPGDEVVVPSLTFFATAEAVVNDRRHARSSATSTRDTWLMTAATAEPAITDRTKALLPVHLFGNPAPMGELMELAESARASRCSRTPPRPTAPRSTARMAGSLGDAATFSFFPSKNLGGFGDGGAIVTADPEVEALARRLRFHGSEDKQTHTEVGYNSRLDELQAAGLRVLLPHLDDWTAARRAAAAGLRATPGSATTSQLQAETEGGESCCHLFVVAHPRARPRCAQQLSEAGIGAPRLLRDPALRASRRWSAGPRPSRCRTPSASAPRSWRCRWARRWTAHAPVTEVDRGGRRRPQAARA